MNLLNILLAANPNGEGGGLASFIPLVLIIVVFYFFMIRPQMKKQKEARKFRENISKGDNVITLGGIYGKVTDVENDSVMLEIANNVHIKVDKSALVQNSADLGDQKK